MIENILKYFDLSAPETKIYLHLLEHGGGTAGDLAGRLGVTRTTLYSALQKMTDKGVIRRTLKHGVRSFYAQSPESLSTIFDQRIDKIETQKKEFHEILPALMKKAGGNILKLNFEYYEGAEGVRRVYQDVLLYRDIETFAFWPPKSMMKILSPDYIEYHNKERIKNNVWIKTIWPETEVVDTKKYPYFGSGEAIKKEVRIAPENMNYTMCSWIYGDKVAFLSSEQEMFGYVIESREMVQLFKAQWDYIWKNSTAL